MDPVIRRVPEQAREQIARADLLAPLALNASTALVSARAMAAAPVSARRWATERSAVRVLRPRRRWGRVEVAAWRAACMAAASAPPARRARCARQAIRKTATSPAPSRTPSASSIRVPTVYCGLDAIDTCPRPRRPGRVATRPDCVWLNRCVQSVWPESLSVYTVAHPKWWTLASSGARSRWRSVLT